MESELEKFRKRKRIEAYKSEAKWKLSQLWSSFTGSITRAVLPNTNDGYLAANVDSGNPTDAGEESVEEYNKKSKIRNRRKMEREAAMLRSEENPTTDPANCRYLVYIQYFLKFLMWTLLYVGFLKLGFGAVFCVISGLWLIWRNLRSDDEKKQGEPSAYSVFNPNCESLDGALKAEDLEKQLMYRT